MTQVELCTTSTACAAPLCRISQHFLTISETNDTGSTEWRSVQSPRVTPSQLFSVQNFSGEYCRKPIILYVSLFQQQQQRLQRARSWRTPGVVRQWRRRSNTAPPTTLPPNSDVTHSLKQTPPTKLAARLHVCDVTHCTPSLVPTLTLCVLYRQYKLF